MSIHAVSWALKLPMIKPGDKLILIAIANFADEWGVCWPGIDTLAEHTNFSERKVRDGIATLESHGLIATVPRRRDDGTRRTDVLVLVGFDGRRRASRAEDHAVVDLVAVDRKHDADAPSLAAAADEPVDNPVDNPVDEPTNRQIVPVDVHVSDPPSTGRFFHSNRQILPVYIRIEPSLEPSEDEERACARAPSCEESGDGHRAAPFGSPSDERKPPDHQTTPERATPAALVARICAALGDPELAENRWWKIEADFGRRIAKWREMGLDDATIVDVARAFGREVPRPPDGPKALEGAMARAAKRPIAAKKPARANAAAPAQPPASWPEGCKDLVDFFGRKIAAGQPVSPMAVSIQMAREMLARGLVTADQLRRRGIAA